MKVRSIEESTIGSVDFDNLVFGRTFTDHMISCEYENGSWGELEITPLTQFQMHPAAHVLHYGQAIFEGLKAYKTDEGAVNLFRVKDNLNRLNRSASRMAMPEIDTAAVLEAIEVWMKMDKAWVPKPDQGSLYIRPFMIATSPTLRAVPSLKYKFMLIASPVGFYYDFPIRVKLESKYSRAAQGGVGAAKAAGNYAASFMPTLEAQNENFDQLIWTDRTEDKNLEELGSANLFYKIGDVIYTPALHDSILAGITRDTVIEIAKESGFEVIESMIPKATFLEQLQSAKIDCLFATGTAASITYIKEVEIDGASYLVDSANNAEIKAIKDLLDDIKFGRANNHQDWSYVL